MPPVDCSAAKPYSDVVYPPGPFGGRAARPLRKDGLSFFEALEMRTVVHVEGFNLSLKYFTARVTPRPSDPRQRTRQQIYLRAVQ